MGPEVLEACVRDVLNTTSVRVMGVLDPLRVVLVDYPEDKVCALSLSLSSLCLSLYFLSSPSLSLLSLPPLSPITYSIKYIFASSF